MCSGILAPEPWPDNALRVYQALVEHAGRDAGAQVRLALWREANGLLPERLKHLALAILTDPDQVTARGLLGHVSFRGRWRRPEDVGTLLASDTRFSATRSEYAARRELMKNSADAHWRLALWCEQEGLENEAVAHIVAVTRRDPAREAAWRRLGYEEHRGRWLRPEQIAGEDAALEAQRKADRYWKPLLAKWRSALALPDDSKRHSVEVKLAGVTDPLAVPAIWATFAPGGPGGQAVAARLLGQVDGPAASRALARLAVFGDSADVCRIATGILARRDLRDVAVLLIDLLAEPIVYEVRLVQGPGSPGVLFVAGKEFNLRRFYTVPPLPDSTIQRLIDPTRPPDGAALVAARLGDNWVRLNLISDGGRLFRNNARAVGGNLERAARATLYAQQQLVNDIVLIETYNRAVAMANARVEAPLRALSGQDHGQDREAWRAWWTDQQGYAYEPPRSSSTTKPTLDQEVPLPYDPGYRQITGMSCFAAGTLVRTREGARPIEAIRPGDVVLTQDTKTGALNFAPVLTVYHNKPAATLRIELDGEDENEPIVATGIHRFWKAGRGWVMARDLKPGDAIRTLGGAARVAAVAADQVQPVFNLEVGENQSFFTGKAAVLVHDNSLVQPIAGPFDEVPDLAVTVSDR